MTTIHKEEQKQQWEQRFQAQEASGLSVVSWCKENNITVSRFYYWRTKLFSKKTRV